MGCGIVKVHILIIAFIFRIRNSQSRIHKNIPNPEKGFRDRKFRKGGIDLMAIHTKSSFDTVRYTQFLPVRFPIPPLET